LSRIAGLIRDRAFAHYFGNSAAADAFRAAQKIPNFLQNLFGEGVLSGSLIPVYARLLGENKGAEADRVASVIATLLALVTSLLAALGILATPFLIDLIAPGFEGEKRALTIQLVQILFPGIALLVMSAWCLGILSSHRRFFLSYAAPVLWNAMIIGALVLFGGRQPQNELAITVAWGMVAGCALQLVVQLPSVFRLLGKFRPAVELSSPHVRDVLRNFAPVVATRGVVQISAYIDNMLASLLPTGAVAALGYAQTIYLLPVSLFGMSVSAASLAEMSRSQGQASGDTSNEALKAHLERGASQIAFFIVPSMAAMLVLGDVIVGALYKTGAFSRDDVMHVWLALGGCAIGLPASTLGRLYSSTFYALQDARSPLRIAILRVIVVTVLGYISGVRVPRWLGVDPAYGIVCLTAASSIAGWLEFGLLRNKLAQRIGQVGLGWSFLLPTFASAAIASGAGFGAKLAMGALWATAPAYIVAVPVCGTFGAVYFLVAAILGVERARSILRRIVKVISRRR
jgi:putative peptidoglycan lipid II flippase